jgi:hypothetical protein
VKRDKKKNYDGEQGECPNFTGKIYFLTNLSISTRILSPYSTFIAAPPFKRKTAAAKRE